ncbi:unnamed protein product [Choristocarpus tenellus]
MNIIQPYAPFSDTLALKKKIEELKEMHEEHYSENSRGFFLNDKKKQKTRPIHSQSEGKTDIIHVAQGEHPSSTEILYSKMINLVNRKPFIMSTLKNSPRQVTSFFRF